jgi:hypothetical protein
MMPLTLKTRLARLEAQTPDKAVALGKGLASLLAYARHHPPMKACDPAEVLDGEPPSGLVLLLQEARACSIR